jgi:hypothetical protein
MMSHKLTILREAWQNYQMAERHQHVLRSNVQTGSPLRTIVNQKELDEALLLIGDSLRYQTKELGSELKAAKELSPTHKRDGQRLIREIKSRLATKQAKPDPFEKAYQQGFDAGFEGSRKRGKPALVKSVFSESYRQKYQFAYNDGFYAGVRERRKKELAKLSPNRSKSRTNSRNGRQDDESR